MSACAHPRRRHLRGSGAQRCWQDHFASNIFVPTETMPEWLQGVVEANPVSVLVTAIRELMVGTYDVGSIMLVGIYCAVLVAVFAPISMYLYNRKS